MNDIKLTLRISAETKRRLVLAASRKAIARGGQKTTMADVIREGIALVTGAPDEPSPAHRAGKGAGA